MKQLTCVLFHSELETERLACGYRGREGHKQGYLGGTPAVGARNYPQAKEAKTSVERLELRQGLLLRQGWYLGAEWTKADGVAREKGDHGCNSQSWWPHHSEACKHSLKGEALKREYRPQVVGPAWPSRQNNHRSYSRSRGLPPSTTSKITSMSWQAKDWRGEDRKESANGSDHRWGPGAGLAVPSKGTAIYT